MQPTPSVTITEVGTRDGLQSQDRILSTEQKASFIRGFVAAGVKRIEATSFVSPKAVPQLADAAELIRLVRDCGATLAALTPNRRGAERAIEAGVNEICVFISASESHSQTNLNMPIAAAIDAARQVTDMARDTAVKARGAIAVAFGCPFEGDVPPGRVSSIVSQMRELGIRDVTLGDTTGMASPRHVNELCAALLRDHPEIDLTLHFHNTRGLGLVNVLEGLKLGIRKFESACGGLGGCPFAPGATGNVCTEDLVYMLSEMGIDTGINLDAMISVANDMEAALGKTLPGQLMRAGPRQRLSPLNSVRRVTGR